MMRFGPAGVPLGCKERSSLSGIACTADLGLDAMELEFVHGCRMTLEKAKECGQLAQKRNVSLSAHASYYLNLISPEEGTLEKSKQQLQTTAKVMDAAGGGRIAIHSGFYLKRTPSEAYPKMLAAYKDLLERTEGLNATFAPEVMGKQSQFGTVEEVYSLAEDLGYDRLRPTIDWGHIHARSNGTLLNKKEEFAGVLGTVEKAVGNEGLKTLHCHVEGIEFTEKGERRHLPLEEGPPSYKMLIEVLKEFKCDGTLICESPLLEKDALRLKNAWGDNLKSSGSSQRLK